MDPNGDGDELIPDASSDVAAIVDRVPRIGEEEAIQEEAMNQTMIDLRASVNNFPDTTRAEVEAVAHQTLRLGRPKYSVSLTASSSDADSDARPLGSDG